MVTLQVTNRYFVQSDEKTAKVLEGRLPLLPQLPGKLNMP